MRILQYEIRICQQMYNTSTIPEDIYYFFFSGTHVMCTYFPSGSVSSVHSFKVLSLNFHGNLHSAFLSGLSSVVRHISPEMKMYIKPDLRKKVHIFFALNLFAGRILSIDCKN